MNEIFGMTETESALAMLGALLALVAAFGFFTRPPAERRCKRCGSRQEVNADGTTSCDVNDIAGPCPAGAQE